VVPSGSLRIGRRHDEFGPAARNASPIANSTALQAFRRAIEASPPNSPKLHQRAIAYYLQEKIRASMLDCQQAVRSCPSHFRALGGLGHCHAT